MGPFTTPAFLAPTTPTLSGFVYFILYRLLRLFVAVFFDLFYVSSLDVFLVALSCNVRTAAPQPPPGILRILPRNHPVGAEPAVLTVFAASLTQSERSAGDIQGMMSNYPTVSCFSLISLVDGGLSIIMSSLFITIAFLLTVSTSNQNPLATELFAAPDSLASLKKFFSDVRVPFCTESMSQEESSGKDPSLTAPALRRPERVRRDTSSPSSRESLHLTALPTRTTAHSMPPRFLPRPPFPSF